MSTTIGVIAPHDLITGIAAVVREQPGTVVMELPYADDGEARELVTKHADVDGWLFSGIVPYAAAAAAHEPFPGPVTYIEYSGPTLAQALLLLTQRGHDISRISVDTLPTDDVTQTYAEAGIPASDVHVLPFSADASVAEAIEFHRSRHTGPGGTHVAITCISAVHAAIADEVPTLRLAPLAASVRIALRQLLLAGSNQLAEDAQVAVGMIQTSGGDAGLAAEAAALGGSLATAVGGSHLLITTRGPLYAATSGFTSLPMLGRLADHHDVVRIGLGLGDTAAAAETRARHALARARVLGDVRAILSLRDGTDMLLDVPATRSAMDTISLPVLARRVGVSVPRLRALQRLREATDDEALTTRDVADHLGIQLRTAHQIVQRLERGGLAERTGHLNPERAGRPHTLYRLIV
ncbi:MarR family winged helix-turn-helix transcriptional regulator [Jiangella asiatica]|uniref:MarR family transcriptional regulator n=1 Tax=Jiangella asiatica TaxID=2530372 RepID=A0A4R5DHV6_9ACTN|nr:MarR family winged helix-turn-helix transcriptional regulator [Jiangella asiatica]TDE11464.1 MarR family transcriptional regulator [Jiangella asiatica]